MSQKLNMYQNMRRIKANNSIETVGIRWLSRKEKTDTFKKMFKIKIKSKKIK